MLITGSRRSVVIVRLGSSSSAGPDWQSPRARMTASLVRIRQTPSAIIILRGSRLSAALAFPAAARQDSLLLVRRASVVVDQGNGWVVSFQWPAPSPPPEARLSSSTFDPGRPG